MIHLKVIPVIKCFFILNKKKLVQISPLPLGLLGLKKFIPFWVKGVKIPYKIHSPV